MVNVVLKNKDEVMDAIKGYTSDMTKRSEKTRIIRSAARNLVKFIRSLAPKRSGELAISVDIISLKAGYFVGPRLKKRYRGQVIKATYARFIEYGTRFMKPYPFMRIGFNVYGKQIIQDMENSYKRLHEKSLAKNGRVF